ncbi:hypothetical protein TWF694_000268 [Orbilia ellipsospora]|uniref:GH16 domain-containing protein n=1 Tax=Orbilia ellipsospora TaxID=2528407 RepID=A0AAV9XPN4_9PEZI
MTFWKTVWKEEFNGPDGPLDHSKWNIIVAGPNSGNDEKQHYTDHTDNVSIKDNKLEIKPQHHGGRWTSARLESKAAFHCPDRETFELKGVLKSGTAPPDKQSGIWPAFWVLGDSSRTHGVEWPECGEIDIFETARGLKWSCATAYSSNVVKGGTGTESAKVNYDRDDFHTWSLVIDRVPTRWQDEKISWELDGKAWFHITGDEIGDEKLWANIAHKDIFVVLDVAVGSNFDGGTQPNGETATGLGGGMQVKSLEARHTIPPP